MSRMTKYFSAATFSVAGILALGAASPAFAQVAPVPEPGVFGIAAAGLAGVVLVALRLRNKK